jgi:hypothetical protein
VLFCIGEMRADVTIPLVVSFLVDAEDQLPYTGKSNIRRFNIRRFTTRRTRPFPTVTSPTPRCFYFSFAAFCSLSLQQVRSHAKPGVPFAPPPHHCCEDGSSNRTNAFSQRIQGELQQADCPFFATLFLPLITSDLHIFVCFFWFTVLLDSRRPQSP